MLNRRGEGGIVRTIVWVAIIVTIFVVLLANVVNLGAFPGVNLDGAPEGAQRFVETVIAVTEPFLTVLFLVVAPVGEDENVQMIAFAIFLLMTLVGTHTLKFAFKGKRATAFFVSAIIGLIAARSLTATVLRDTALGASPLATASLLLGFIPIYALTNNLDRWSLTNFSKILVYTIAAFVYLAIFWIAFDAVVLGLIYAIGIMLLGGGEVVLRTVRPELQAAEDRRAGQFIAQAGQVERTAREMQRGARRFGGTSWTGPGFGR